MNPVEKAAAQLAAGRPVVIYDDEKREGEADIVFSARLATPEKVELLRRDAGGLICAALGKADADALGLPFYAELLEQCGKPETGNSLLAALACKKTAYGDKSAFSVSVNHRGVFTGITDDDRALTLRKLDALVRWSGRRGSAASRAAFAKQFYSPGHVPLLIGSGLDKRRGHTELSLELARSGGLNVMVLCEMLGSGKALAKKDAMAYARRNGLVFIEGRELVGK
jgi:3,4-dihydroxy 2-butanone 4-phosphate synthase